ncbi:RNA-directed DNA polymerase, eukaryota, reverse transcriptase zinc-binding domain protein [Tanacetum coccineum]
MFSFLNALWVKVIKSLHGQEGGFDNRGCKFNDTWARIIGTSNFLHLNDIILFNSFSFCVRCGTRIQFWKDIWLGDSPLFIRYNRLYRLDQDKNCLIIDRIVNGQWKWNWSRKDIGVHNTTYLRDMFLEIIQVDLNAVDDHCVWTMAKEGIFSVGESRRIIDSKLLFSLVRSTSWDKTLLRKVNIFIWRLGLDRLPHRWNLSARGIDIPSILCSSCNVNVESSSHIFFDCDFAKRPLTKHVPEHEMIGSSSRIQLTNTILEVPIPQPTGPVIDITPPEQPESPPTAPKVDRGKGKVTNDVESPSKLVKASSKVCPDLDNPIQVPYMILAGGGNHSKEKEQGDARFVNFIRAMRYEKLGTIPDELGIRSNLPAPTQILSITLRRKRKHQELNPETHIRGLECNRSLPKGIPFVNNMVIEQPEHVMFFIDVFCDEAFQRMSDIHKVDVENLLTYLVMASNISIPENQKFYLALRKLIGSHPDQEKLKSKKVKLESVGYKLD